MLQLSHPSLSNVVTCCRFFDAFSYSHRQTPIMLHPQFQDDARVPPNFWFCAKATLNLCQRELLAWLKNRHITAKYQIEGRESSTYRNYSCHFAGFRIFILQRQGAGRWSWGGGVNGYAHRNVLILPVKRVFPFFGVEASLGDESSLRRFTFGRRKCSVEPAAWQQIYKKNY